MMACPALTSNTPSFDSTRSDPFKTTVYSSNSGCCPGSLQPEGLCMWAMLTAESLVFTRPTYSSICLLPGTGMRVALGIRRGIALSCLVIALGDQFGQRVHGPLVGRIRELAQDGAGTFRKRLRSLAHAIEPMANLDHTKDLLEWGIVVIALSEHGAHQLPLFRRSLFQRVDERQRNFALSQIAAHGLAEYFFVRCEVQHVVDELECDAQVPGEFAQPR